MELILDDFDCTKFTLPELLTFVAEFSPIHYNVLGHAYKKLAAGGSPDRVKAVLPTPRPSQIFAILKYVVATFRSLQKTKITDVLPVASMMGATITVADVPCPTGIYAGVEDKPEVQSTVYFEASHPHPDANKFDKRTVEIEIGDTFMAAPLFMGEPVIDAELQQGCKETLGLDVPTSNPKEISVAHRIVDLFVFKKNHFMLKPLETCKAMRIASEDKDLRHFGLLLDQAFAVPFQGGSQSSRGRDLLNRILVAMEQARKLGSYDKTMGTLVNLFVKLSITISTPRSFGELYPKGSLGYAYHFLDFTRGLRGGDDKDNTSIGLSSYLPYNVPRMFVRHMARIQDLIALVSIIRVKRINLVGEGSDAYAQSLSLLTKCPLEYVGMSAAAKLNLSSVKPGYYSRDKSSLTFGPLDPGELYVDVTLDNFEKPWTITTAHYALDNIVRMIRFPSDAGHSMRFVPSVFPHRLMGWLLPISYKGIKGTATPSECDNYLNLSLEINKVRTLPSYFKARAYDLVPKNYRLSPGIMRIVVKQTSALGIDVESLSGENYGDLSSAYEAFKVAKGIEDTIPIIAPGGAVVVGGVGEEEAIFDNEDTAVCPFSDEELE
jgi:hypothetical protein